MKLQVQKWGDGLVVRIPNSAAVEAGLQEGSIVDLHRNGDQVVLAPVAKLEYTLEELLAGVTRGNLHGETDFGEPVGRESW
jgi:antitoxin MazE